MNYIAYPHQHLSKCLDHYQSPEMLHNYFIQGSLIVKEAVTDLGVMDKVQCRKFKMLYFQSALGPYQAKLRLLRRDVLQYLNYD